MREASRHLPGCDHHVWKTHYSLCLVIFFHFTVLLLLLFTVFSDCFVFFRFWSEVHIGVRHLLSIHAGRLVDHGQNTFASTHIIQHSHPQCSTSAGGGCNAYTGGGPYPQKVVRPLLTFAD